MFTDNQTIPKRAAVLGYSGVVPFATAAILVGLDFAGMRQVALEGFLIYSAGAVARGKTNCRRSAVESM
jgi:hypothetical protein